MALLKRLDLHEFDSCKDLFSEDFIWHYHNARLPDLDGSYHGVEGPKAFFSKLGAQSAGSFVVTPVDGHLAGNELVFTQVCNHMEQEGNNIEFDAVVIWRVVNNQIAEAWDIPAINTIRIKY